MEDFGEDAMGDIELAMEKQCDTASDVHDRSVDVDYVLSAVAAAWMSRYHRNMVGHGRCKLSALGGLGRALETQK